MLHTENLTVQMGKHSIIQDITITLEENQWLMVVGPNGAGKTTFINALTQGATYTGNALLHGREITRIKPLELAKNLGVLAQSHRAEYAFTVEEVVRLGRYAHSQGPFAPPPQGEDDAVTHALESTGMLELKNHTLPTLSGGELQRTFLAQVFAQKPKILILDEPANHLDLPYQKMIFELVQAFAAQPGRAVLSVVHDLSLAKAFGTHALLMNAGKQVATGPIHEVLQPKNLQGVYQMDVQGWLRSMLGQWAPSAPE